MEAVQADPFDTFTKLAFRVEALPQYVDADGSSRELEDFKRHGQLPPDHNHEWANQVAAARDRGARVARLRIVSSPISEYESFEIRAGYAAGIAAGEEIRITTQAGPSAPVDFWAYDGTVLEVMKYDTSGRFLGSDIRDMTVADTEMVDSYWDIFEKATPIPEFLLD